MNFSSEHRSAGLFVPLFALRSHDDLGVGDTETLIDMIRWCRDQQLKVLQLLPINETSDDHSPYNAISSVAIEPSTLALSPESVPGLIDADLEEFLNDETRHQLSEGPVQYAKVKSLKRSLLERGFSRFVQDQDSEIYREWQTFCQDENDWLMDYALFRIGMESHDGSPVWDDWSDHFKDRTSVETWLHPLAGDEGAGIRQRVDFFQYLQWVAYRQWDRVRAIADECGVALMGDIPFGLSRYSADVWADRESFDLDWSGGAPPEPLFQDDAFVKRWGQNWGIPLYDWERMAASNYAWWRRRVRMTVRIFRSFRIDHILGFYRIYAFPWPPQQNHEFTDLSEEDVIERCGALPQFLPQDDETAENKALNCEHGKRLLTVLLDEAQEAVVIGEDLGVVPDYVRPNLEKLGISGFKIPVFERDEATKEYRKPENYPKLSLCTLSTHDHLTMKGFWENWWSEFEQSENHSEEGAASQGEQASWELYRTQRFAQVSDEQLLRDYDSEVYPGILERFLGAQSWLAIINITDLLGLDLRFNVPGPVADSNWSSRLPMPIRELSMVSDHQKRLRLFGDLMVSSDRTG